MDCTMRSPGFAVSLDLGEVGRLMEDMSVSAGPWWSGAGSFLSPSWRMTGCTYVGATLCLFIRKSRIKARYVLRQTGWLRTWFMFTFALASSALSSSSLKPTAVLPHISARLRFTLAQLFCRGVQGTDRADELSWITQISIVALFRGYTALWRDLSFERRIWTFDIFIQLWHDSNSHRLRRDGRFVLLLLKF